jgi:hypothetical protein
VRLLRLAVGLALAALVAASCAQSPAQDCPGEPLAFLSLRGVRDDAATGCVAPPVDGWVVPAVLPTTAPTAERPEPTFSATLETTGGDGVAYCTAAPRAAVLYGVQSGTHVRVEVTMPGAVLGACAPTCRPIMTEVIEGELEGGAFTGTLTERFDGGVGDCGVCVLPCASRYVLTGTARTPGT